MADTSTSSSSSDDTQPKSMADKVVDIIHHFISGGTTSGGETPQDPVSDTIKTLSNTSRIGGGYQKARMDAAIKASGG